jgi:purine-nucleoside phosphorylase
MNCPAGYRERLEQTTAFLAERLDPCPRVCIIAGTGLGGIAEPHNTRLALPYGDIPNMPVSTVTGHEGRLVAASLGGKNVVVLQGRFHLYEGYSPWEVTFPLRALSGLGLESVILTNAAGGLNPEFSTGDIMLISDHMNMTGQNPLAGPHVPEWGPRFPDMSSVYDAELQTVAEAAAAAVGLTLRRGVYVQVKGPCLETPAETRFFRLAGADAIGMSTVQEAIVAVQSGLRILAFSAITNMNIPDSMQPTSAEDVIRVAQKCAPRLARLIHEVLRNWPQRQDETRPATG